MDAAGPGDISVAIDSGYRMRVGRKLRRTLYLHPPEDDPGEGTGFCVGIVDSEYLAERVAALWNEQHP